MDASSFNPPVYDSRCGACNPFLGVRTQKSAANLPATAAQNLFSVSGEILITLFRGRVTTEIQDQACNLKVTSVPSSGSAVDLAANLNIQALEAGAHLVVKGDGSALVASNAGAALGPLQFGGIVPAGAIRIQTSATNTGATSWELWYFPLDDGATVTAA